MLKRTFLTAIFFFWACDASAVLVTTLFDSLISSPLDVECQVATPNNEGNLSFGTITISGGNSAGTVTVPANDTPAANVTGTGIVVSGDYRAALCTVTDVFHVLIPAPASVVLSGPGGTWSGNTLSGVTLKNAINQTLDVSLTVSTTSISSRLLLGLLQPGRPVFIGGTLSIPANTTLRGTFTETFTITVTQ